MQVTCLNKRPKFDIYYDIYFDIYYDIYHTYPCVVIQYPSYAGPLNSGAASSLATWQGKVDVGRSWRRRKKKMKKKKKRRKEEKKEEEKEHLSKQ